MDIVVFEVAGHRYGLPLTDTDEILRAVLVTPLPKAPRIIEGIINVRGAVVPVLDFRARFGLPPQPPAPNEHVIMARTGGRRVGIRADRVTHLASVASTDITPAEEVTRHSEYVAGIAKLPDGLALIHDLDTFLTSAEAATLDHVMAEHAVRTEATL